MHTGLAVALYISLQERLPSPLEVLACHKEVQEQEADDFIRRWIAAEKLKQYLGSGRSILFVILNADLLKPSIQNMLLSKIQGGVSVGDTGECFLCSSLRNDWAHAMDSPLSHYGAACKSFFDSAFPNIHVVSSHTANNGKTTTILNHFVCNRVTVVSYGRIPLVGDFAEVVDLSETVEGGREAFYANKNTPTIGNLNRFLLALVTGLVTD